MTTPDDLFRFFEANANGMEAFAREAGVAPAPPAAEPKQSLWERLGLGLAPAPVKKPRRRLATRPQAPLLPSSQTS